MGARRGPLIRRPTGWIGVRGPASSLGEGGGRGTFVWEEGIGLGTSDGLSRLRGGVVIAVLCIAEELEPDEWRADAWKDVELREGKALL